VVRRRPLLALAALVVAGGLWYWFRPERLVVDRRVREALPAAAAGTAPLLRGTFRGLAHATTGTAAVYRGPGGDVLRLEQFTTSDGPDVVVYLVAATDVDGDAVVERSPYVSLGPLKGNVGDQNYALPPGLDLARYRSVVIWCRRFSVAFGAATLS
jgi:hypothetical protein